MRLGLRATGSCCVLATLLVSREAAADGAHHFADQSFVDDAGERHSFDLEYERWFRTRKPHYFRAAVEAAVAVGIGTAYYWGDPLANEVDWDDPSVGSKVTGQAVRFDTNLPSTNFLLHPGAGAIVYGFSRVNGLDPYASFVYTVASAVVWEFALEWREQASVNDMIFTPIGGMAMGEFFFRLGDYVNSAGPHSALGNDVARYTIGLPQAAHDAADGVPRRSTGISPDGLGFSSAYWHRFSLRYGLGLLENDAHDDGFAQSLEATSELVALPGFLRPGRYELSFDEGNFTEARLRMLVGDGGLDEVDLWISAVHFGRYSQDFSARGGAATMFGMGTALRYFDSWLLDRRDGYAFAHLPGPVVGLWHRWGDVWLETRIEGHLDFGAVRPLAFPEWSERFGSEGLKAVLIKQGYSYGGCASSQARARLAYEGFSLGGFATAARCHSIQGLDRFQDEVTRDVATIDDVVELGASATVKPAAPIEVRAQFEQVRRRGEMGSVEARRCDDFLGLTVGYLF